MSCPAFEQLVGYWLGEPVDGDDLENHVFACAGCSPRLEWLAALGAGVRAVVRGGLVGMVASPGFVEALRKAGLRLREYTLNPGTTVNCTIAAEDDAVVSTIRAPLGAVKRLDALWRVEVEGEATELRLEDVPFDAARGEVRFMPAASVLKRMPAHRQEVRLVAVDEAGEREIGEYTFAHQPQ